MKTVKLNSCFLIYFLILFFVSNSCFAQLDKASCQEIIGNLKIKDFDGISLITHVLTTDSDVERPCIYVFSPLLLVFKENYLTIEGNATRNQRNLRTIYVPYNKIKFISTYTVNGVFVNQNTIEIYLIE